MPHPFPAADGSSPKSQEFPDVPEMGIDPAKRYTATMETSMGSWSSPSTRSVRRRR